MSFTDVFGGETIFPSLTSYNSITTAVDVVLQWPREQQIEGVNVVADWMDIDTTAVSLNIDMPAATSTSTGNKVTFNNIGSNDFTVRDSAGGTIITIAPGEQWVLVLTDNSTAAGAWIESQLGATVSVSNAAALAGSGIKAISSTLNQMIDSDVEAATPFTVVDSDRAKCSVYTAGAGTANLPSPGSVGNDWFFMIRNSGSGTLNVVPPSGVIDGGASLNLDPNDSCFIFTDGTDFFTVGLSSGSSIAFDFVSIAVPGSGDFVLSGANLDRISYRFTGALTGDRRIVVPNTTQQYWVDNQTSGAFNLEIDTAAGAGQTITQGQSAIVYCDATDVINAVSSTSVAFPITVGQGGTGATTVGGAQTNLDVPPNSRTLINGAGIAASGLGDLSADRTINAELATETQIGVAEIATQTETDTGTDDARIVTPLKLANFSGLVTTGANDIRRKNSDTVRNLTTTVTADPDLGSWNLEQFQNFLVEGLLFVTATSTTPDFRIGFLASAGQMGGPSQWQFISNALGSPTIQDITVTGNTAASGEIIVPLDVSTRQPISFKGILRCEIASTVFEFGWAQGTSDASFVTLENGSYINIINTDLGSFGTSALFLS